MKMQERAGVTSLERFHEVSRALPQSEKVSNDKSARRAPETAIGAAGFRGNSLRFHWRKRRCVVGPAMVRVLGEIGFLVVDVTTRIHLSARSLVRFEPT